MNENDQLKAQQDVQSNVQNQEVNNFSNYNVQRPAPKKKGKGLLIFAIIILILIAAFVGGYAYFTSPAQYYKLQTGLMMKNALNNIEIPEYETSKSTLKLDVELEQEMEMMDKEIIDLINDLTLELGLQEDKKQQQFVVDVDADYDKEELIKAQMFIDAKEEKSYIYMNELLDKYLEIELEDYDVYSELTEIYETEKELLENPNVQKAIEIIGKEIVNSIKPEYCSSDKVTININSEEVKTSCKTIEMTAKQYMNSIATIADNLAKNEEFIGLIEEEYKEEAKEFLNSLKEELEQVEEEGKIKLNTYTTGLIPKVVKVEVIVENEDEYEEDFAIEVVKLEEQKYSYALKVGDTTVMQGTTSNKENAIGFSIDIEDFGSLKVDMEMKQEFNVPIDTINKNNTASIEDLTEKEQQDLMKNFQDSKLYELVNEFMPEDDTNSSFDEDYSDSLFDEDDDDYSSLFGEEEEDDTNSLFDTNTEAEDGNNSASALQDNQIKTYDNKTLITFGKLSGYEYDKIDDNYQTLSKNDIEITVTSSYGDENEYYSDLKSTKEYFEGEPSYSDVTLSNQTTAQIGGRTFYKATLSYKYNSSEFRTDYIWAKVSDNYCVEFEIENINDMTNEELKQLLTITIEN